MNNLWNFYFQTFVVMALFGLFIQSLPSVKIDINPEVSADSPEYEYEYESDDYLQRIVWQAAQRYKLDPLLLSAIVKQESNWDPKVVSEAGAIGLTQVMPKTGLSECGLTKKQLFDQEKNADCGAMYFAKQLKRFKSVKLALCAYNAGPTLVGRLGRCPRIKETTEYAKRILGDYKRRRRS